MANFRVLAVDDDEEITELVCFLIDRSSQNIDVDAYNDPRDALDSFEDVEDYDMVISDWEMPYLDGEEFGNRIRANNSEIPIIYFTGRSKENVYDAVFELGADYLNKSNMKELTSRVETAITRIEEDGEESLDIEIEGEDQRFEVEFVSDIDQSKDNF